MRCLYGAMHFFLQGDVPVGEFKVDGAEGEHRVKWIDPYPGFDYRPMSVSIEAAYQHDKLGACGIDSGVFGNDADPAFFIGLAIHAGINSGISAEGNVNLAQHLVQHRPLALGESLTALGGITAVQPVPRGRVIHTVVRFETAAGETVIEASRQSLKPHPGPGKQRGIGDRPISLLEDIDSLTAVADYELNPAQVKAYSSTGNSIHYEEESAHRAGFRAPIIGGGMGVHYLTACLWSQRPVRTLVAQVQFRRPIFWDDRLAVIHRQLDQDTRVLGLRVRGKAATEMSVRELTF